MAQQSSRAGRRSRRGQRRGPEWRKYLEAAGGNGRFAEYLLAGRQRFLAGEAATVDQVRAVYTRAAHAVRRDVEGLTAGTLRRSHLEAVASRLETRTAELREGLLQATQRGIRIAAASAVDAPKRIALGQLAGWFRTSDVAALFADVQERATLSLLARTGHDGLRISDRIWRIGEEYRSAISRIIEDAIARGEDARTTARKLEQYIHPGVATPLKDETRRRLLVPKNVSMQALRLAVTEVQHAHHEAAIAAFHALPSYQGSYWRLSNAHVVRDICDEYAEHNGDGLWPKGDEPPKPHPWCRCYVVPKLEPSEDFADRIRAWIEDPASQPDIEAWYQETARRILGRPVPPATPAGRSSRTRLTRSQRLHNYWATTMAGRRPEQGVLDQALKDIIAAAEQAYTRQLFEGLGVRVETQGMDDLGRVHIRVAVGEKQTEMRLHVSEEMRSEAQKRLDALDRAKTALDRWKALRELVLAVSEETPEKRRARWRYFTSFLSSDAEAWRRWFDQVLLEAEEAVSEALNMRAVATFDDRLSDAQRATAEAALDKAASFLRRVLRGPVLDRLEAPNLITVEPVGRAYYNVPNKHVALFSQRAEGKDIDERELASIAVHEMLHHVDLGGRWGHPLRIALERFFEQRISNNDNTWRRATDEWGYIDDFWHDYMGRVYGDALRDDPSPGSEIPTMVMQYLYLGATGSYKGRHLVLTDPDMVSLVVGVLKGVGAP